MFPLMFSVFVKSETGFISSVYSETLQNSWSVIVAGYSVCWFPPRKWDTQSEPTLKGRYLQQWECTWLQYRLLLLPEPMLSRSVVSDSLQPSGLSLQSPWLTILVFKGVFLSRIEWGVWSPESSGQVWQQSAATMDAASFYTSALPFSEFWLFILIVTRWLPTFCSPIPGREKESKAKGFVMRLCLFVFSVGCPQHTSPFIVLTRTDSQANSWANRWHRGKGCTTVVTDHFWDWIWASFPEILRSLTPISTQNQESVGRGRGWWMAVGKTTECLSAILLLL